MLPGKVRSHLASALALTLLALATAACANPPTLRVLEPTAMPMPMPTATATLTPSPTANYLLDMEEALASMALMMNSRHSNSAEMTSSSKFTEYPL